MSLEWVLGVVIIVSAVPYVLGPILVWFQQRAPADPHFEPFDVARHAVPAELANGIESTVTPLEQQGFRRVADLFHASEVSTTPIRLALLTHEGAGLAAIAAAVWDTRPKAPPGVTYVEFAVKFRDERAFSVHNSPQPEVYGRHPLKLTTRIPQVRDPARLWHISRELLRRRYGSVSGATFDMSDPAGFLARAMVREYRQQVETGYFQLDEAAQVFRPTWRGAWIMTWRLLPPMSQVREWLTRRRAAALLEELRLTGPDPRPIPVPRRSDPLRWNLVVLVAAVALLLLTR